MTIDINKTYRTRDGRAVTGLHKRSMRDGNFPSANQYPFGGIVEGCNENWTDDGLFIAGTTSATWDLVLVEDAPAYTAAPKPLDLTKPVQLRDGTPARIVSTSLIGGSDYPLGIIFGQPNAEEFNCYTAEGRQSAFQTGEDDRDLVNTVPTVTEFYSISSGYGNHTAARNAHGGGWPVIQVVREAEGNRIVSAEVVPA